MTGGKQQKKKTPSQVLNLKRYLMKYNGQFHFRYKWSVSSNFKQGKHNLFTVNLLYLGPPTGLPPGCLMRHTATFVHCVYTIKIAHLFFHVRHKNQPTITGVTLCHKTFGDTRFKWIISINLLGCPIWVRNFTGYSPIKDKQWMSEHMVRTH